MLLNTITVVGTGVSKRALGNNRVKTSRNCSRRVATLRMSFSPAFPTKRKFLVRTLVQLSFAWIVAGTTRRSSKPAKTDLRPERIIVETSPDTGRSKKLPATIRTSSGDVNHLVTKAGRATFVHR